MSGLRAAFKQHIMFVPIDKIVPQNEISEDTRKSISYRQIMASVQEIGLIEPLVVYPESSARFLLLDGHCRLEALKSNGATEARCILSTDDEAYTYNRRVNSIPPVAQHLMLLEALRGGLSEERIAASLKVDVSVIRQKRDMLNGICKETVELLRDRQVNAKIFHYLRKMKPLRQVEAAEHMIANSSYSLTFVQALLYATKPELLNEKPKIPPSAAPMEPSRNLLIQESEQLLTDLKRLQQSFGKDALALTVCQGYIERLLKNPRVMKYLERRHKETLGAMQSWIQERRLGNISKAAIAH